MKKKYNVDDYPYNIRPLSKEEGGGYLIEYPDLPGCYSDGETVLEARENGRDAAFCWLQTAVEDGDEIPVPGIFSNLEQFSGRLSQRVPKSMHLKLQRRAKLEGVSINQLVIVFIAEGLSHMQDRGRSNSCIPTDIHQKKSRPLL